MGRGSVQMPTTGATKREASSEHPDSTLLSLEDLAQIRHSPISVLDREDRAAAWKGPLGPPDKYPHPRRGRETTPEWRDGGPGEVSYVPYWSQYIYFSLAVKCRHEGLCWVQQAADVSRACRADR